MNFEQDLERKACSMQNLPLQQQQAPPPPPLPSLQARRSQQHQVHALANLKPPFVQQTKLNLPLPVPSKSFPDFNENLHLFPTQQFKLMSLSTDFNTPANGQPESHDDNYHLYHEPIDLDDEYCVRELLETETNYVHALEMILTGFARPLESFLRKDDYQLIFGHIKHFYHIHSGLLAELTKAALRSYNKDVTSLGSTGYNSHTLTANHKSNQASSIPTTPTLAGNIPQFLNSSPLSTPTTQEAQGPLATSIVAHSKNSNSTTLRISSCFLNMREKFLKYGEYCASLSKAQALLDELSGKNEAFASQLDRCQQDANEGKFKLRDLLSLPMQRILKYHLLLGQLIKNTSSTNDDYYGLKKAYEAMVYLGQYINEVKRDTEAIQIILKIEQTITGLNMPPNTQLTDYGRFIHDGFVRVKSPLDVKAKVSHDSKLKLPNDIKLKQKRYFFVFDKVMLLCKGSNYQYKEALVLSEFELDIENDSVSKHVVKDKWNYNFNLIHNTDPTNVYSFSAKTLENKLKLVEAIQRAMDNIRPAACRDGATNHEFLMHTFEKASSCDHCGKLLLGLYYQGYRCRICFSSVHKKCIGLIKACGPTLPLKTSNMMTISRNRATNEPTSPSIRSNCSEEDGGGGGGANPTVARSYVNFILNDYPWFVGRMERDTAQGLLESMPSGTFLVRVSPKHNHSYVISLNYNSQVKHMRILVSEDNRLYLSENRHFKSVIDLVSWYEKNSLIESFPNLYAHLAFPYKGN